jgi:hypothetical protein
MIPCLGLFQDSVYKSVSSSTSNGPSWKVLKGLETAKIGCRQSSRSLEISETSTHTLFRANKVVSRRLKLHGAKLVEGDLVEASDDHYEVIDSNNISKFTIYDIVIPLVGSTFE